MGAAGDFLYSLRPTGEGGYVAAGFSSRNDPNGDFYVAKVSANGSPEWDFIKNLGGIDALESVQQTLDGGYVACGYTTSFNGEYGAYMVKLNSSGAEVWNQSSWGTSDITWDRVIQAGDGGYAAAGQISPHNSPIITPMLFKFYPNGTQEWNRSFVQNDNNIWGRGIALSNDGGYVMMSGVGGALPGEYDVFLAKTDSSGNVQWNMTYGLANDSESLSLIATGDGGYAFAGSSWPPDFSSETAWLVKTYPNGTLEWNRTYHSSGRDFLGSVQQTSDGGYLLSGNSNFSAWVLKTDANGNEIWHVLEGGGTTNAAGAQDAVQAADGGYLVLALTAMFDPNYNSWLFKIVDVPGSRANFMMRNSLLSTVYLDSISFRGNAMTFPQPIKFGPGERRSVSFAIPPGVCGYKGELVELDDLTISYTQGMVSGLVQSGAIPLVLRCS